MIRLYSHATNFAAKLVQGLVAKLSQHPEFYNIRHYKKMKSRGRKHEMFW
ncbi:MAG: hypothetical protein ABJA57_01995 [Ginsengibacter sp.]